VVLALLVRVHFLLLKTRTCIRTVTIFWA
jgi:hypothetical protein